VIEKEETNKEGEKDGLRETGGRWADARWVTDIDKETGRETERQKQKGKEYIDKQGKRQSGEERGQETKAEREGKGERERDWLHQSPSDPVSCPVQKAPSSPAPSAGLGFENNHWDKG
jgi:hypothetical protein